MIRMTLEEYNSLPTNPNRDRGRRLAQRLVPWGLVRAGEASHQRQARDRYLGTPPPPNACLKLSQAVVRPVSKALADKVILAYEWLGSVQKTDKNYGIFLGGELGDEYCAGVVCIGTLSVTGGSNLHRRFGLEKEDVRVLARGACTHFAPMGTNSKLIRKACKLLQKEEPWVRLLVAFADPEAGEAGVIYEATGWFMVGLTLADKSQYVAPPDPITGEVKVYDRSIINAKAKREGTTWATAKWDLLLNRNWYIQDNSQKYVCVYPMSLSKTRLQRRFLTPEEIEFEKIIAEMSRPYVKRVVV